MITSNLVVEGVPGNHHHHHHHHPHHHHHHALAATGNHPLHSFSAIHHHLNHNQSSRAHLMSASTFAEPFLKAANGPTAGGGGGGSLLQPSPPEFAHPLPKPAPLVPRYNGVTSSSLNGAAKPPQSSRLSNKYPPPESESPHVPVNLVQSKESLPPPSSSPQSSSVSMDVVGHPAYSLYTSSSRLYQPNPTYPPHFAAPPPPPPPSSLPTGPYGPLYPPNPFTPLLHRSGTGTDGHRSTSHLLALQQYPEASTPSHHLKSPPTSAGHNGMLKTIYEPPLVPIVASEPAVSLPGGRGEKRFKVPSGKEGSMKHRILTRPEPARSAHKKSSSSSLAARASHANALLPPPSSSPSVSSASSCAASMTSLNMVHKNGLTSTAGLAESTPAAIVNANHTNGDSYSNIGCNNSSGGGDCAANTILPKFIKGSLIQLADGSTKKVEDMQTEDFISCVENSTTMRIDPSTVVRIQESAHKKGMTTVTLSYGEQRNQVDVESSVEHPYFVVKRGWSSYMPNKTLQIYRLFCHQLQVGDVCLTLSRKSNSGSSATAGGGAGGSNQRRPNGQATGNHVVETSKGPQLAAATAKKNDLRITSAPDNDNDDCRSNSSSSSTNSGSCNGSSSSNNSSNSGSSVASNAGHGSSSSNGTSNHHQLHQLTNGGSGVDGKFGRVALVNGHEEAKKFVAKAAENDDNNNSNSTGDKYEAPSAKKKRRWSAPEQIGDEYQPPSISPLASPPVSVAAGGVGGAAGMSKNNV